MTEFETAARRELQGYREAELGAKLGL